MTVGGIRALPLLEWTNEITKGNNDAFTINYACLIRSNLCKATNNHNQKEVNLSMQIEMKGFKGPM